MQGRHVVMSGAAVVAVAAVAAGVALAAPAGGSHRAVSIAAQSSGGPASSSAPGSGSAPGGSASSSNSVVGRRLPGQSPAGSRWRVSRVARLSARMSSVVVDPRKRTAFELIADSKFVTQGPFRLRRISLASGGAVTGPRFPVSQVSLAGGYVWLSGAVVRGQSARFALYQVSPATLKVIRSWRLTGWRRAGLDLVAVTGGPRGTVWVGYSGQLRRLNPRTGATLSRVRLPAGRHVSDVAADPSGRHLYASAWTRKGAVIGEYAGGSGRPLASQAGVPLKYSAGGADVTAVPGGVWATFRTGMLGEAVLLRRPGLSVIPLPGKDKRIYSFAMGAGTTYGGGSLWLSQSISGKTACIAPGTGRVRSAATLKALANFGTLLAVSSSAHVVFAVGKPGLVAISAPRACWR